MEIVQFENPQSGRHVGLIEGEGVHDVTATAPKFRFVYDVFVAAMRANRPLADFLRALIPAHAKPTLDYRSLWNASPGGSEPFLRPPIDHPDPHRVLVTGTGLTHTGSMKSRDQMHGGLQADDQASAPEQPPATDSARMFAMGVKGGRPAPGNRGAAPEWFYKGDGGILRGHRDPLEIPDFALDGGEEPEIVGCYMIDEQGRPRRLGFALGNEWSDHATEQINYLYLAPSKLRTCAIGPSLNTHSDFQEIDLHCTVTRDGRTTYDSGDLHSGERWMSHSLANLEDHHFKYPQHRRPGDIHLHFFGTSKLSFSTRNWKFQDGDEIRIDAPGFSAPLVNPVRSVVNAEPAPLVVEPA